MSSNDLVITQGATWGVIIPVLQRDDDDVLVPADLTGWSVRSQVRKAPSSSTVLYQWSTAAGNATTEGSNVILTTSAAESAAFTWKTGVYDIELHQGAIVHRIKEGAVTVDPEVTRG